ncbi:MAG: hypothetical protein IT381_07910 [Deltaproteobacteria bacterium]|nr:hypothetical protein [Deltaproteobacteria bacterium]
MKIFVLGISATGKTPFAEKLAARLQISHIKASAWVRRMFPAPVGTKQDHIEAMTKFSTDALKDDPDACLRHVRAEPGLHGDCVIEGMRNPRDFVHVFDPRTDVAIVLTKRAHDLKATEFETGIEVIKDYVQWSMRNGLSPQGALVEHVFDFYKREEGSPSLDDAINATVSAFAGKLSAPNAGKAAHVHAEIPPIALMVKKALLYGGDPKHAGQRLPCRAFVVSSYPASTPTFKVLLEDGAVFSYLPPSALTEGEPMPPELSLEDLVYANCPTGDFCVHDFATLHGPVLAYFKRRDLWMKGRYRLTLDWYEGNDLLHLVSLENGQQAFLPHHKLKFGDHPQGFEPYKKLRAEWKVAKG